jgi:hypothetical protein
MSTPTPHTSFWAVLLWSLRQRRLRSWLAPKTKREAVLYTLIFSLTLIVLLVNMTRNRITVNVYQGGERTIAAAR